MSKRERSRVGRVATIIAAQVVVTAVVGGCIYVVRGRTEALSALVGGAIAFIPATLYAGRMLAVTGSDPRRLLRAQYRAEAFKTAGTIGLFALTFIFFRNVSPVWLFLTYIAALLVYFAALLFDR